MAPDRQKVIQAAEKLVGRGRIQAAIDEYRKVLERYPNDTSTLNRVGDLYARLNRMPKAIELFQQTAEGFGKQGFFVKAIAIYKKIIRLDPSQINAYEALADLYNRQGLTGDSLAQYQVVADYYQKHDDAEAALGVYRNMVEIEPSNPTRRLQLAGLLQEEGQLSKALEQYFEIASLMLGHSRGEDALRVLLGALDVDAGNLDFVRRAIHLLEDGGFDQLGADLLDAAAERNPAANTLRLDALEKSPAERSAPEAEPESESKAEAEPEAGADTNLPPVAVELEFEEPLLEQSVDADQDEASDTEELAVLETAVDIDLSELDLGDIEELSAGQGVDPELPASTSALEQLADDQPVEDEPSEPEVVLDLADPGEASEFVLDPVEDIEQPEPVEQIEEVREGEADGDQPLGLEFDLDEIELEPELESEPEQVLAEEASPEASSDLEISGESIKLLIEAEVLSRYGMDDMAIAVLDKIVRAEPRHCEAMARLVRLQLRTDRSDEALAVANQLADEVARSGAPGSWDAVCEAMAERDFVLENGRFVATGEPVEPAPEPEPELEVEQELELATESEGSMVEEPIAEEELAVEEPEAEKLIVEPDTPPAAGDVEEVPRVEEPVDQSLEELVADAAVFSRPQRPLATEDVLAGVIEEIEREAGAERSLDGQKEDEQQVAESEVVDEPEVADKELDWLRELERAEAEDAEPVSEEFVDLATELEAELSEEGELEEELLPNLREQSLEDIVEGFRQGMSETLSDEDYDTHYNLGVAFREMELIDEAIAEFQLAAKDPRYLVECCSLLAACFVDKSFYDLAVQWYARGVESPAVDQESKMGLLYELGTLLAATGEPQAARARFLEIYGMNSNYRDIVAKLEELPE